MVHLDMTIRELIQMLDEIGGGSLTMNDGAGDLGVHPTWCLAVYHGESAERFLALVREFESRLDEESDEDDGDDDCTIDNCIIPLVIRTSFDDDDDDDDDDDGYGGAA